MISGRASVYRRGYQLRATTGPSLADLRRHYGYVRWVVVLRKDDYAGRPREDVDLLAWVRHHYGEFIDAGLLALFRAEPHVEDGAFHMSRSKNTSHAAAIRAHRAVTSGRNLAAEPQPFQWVDDDAGNEVADKNHILVNLDCDNIAGRGFVASIVSAFGVAESASSQPGPRKSSARWRGREAATTGRVAGMASLFQSIHRYDE